MVKEADILKIVKEDILEVVGRKNKSIPLKSMELEVTVSPVFVSKAIKELEKEVYSERSCSNNPNRKGEEF